MQCFRRILFISEGIVDESNALRQALSLARNHKASLTALIVCPNFPITVEAYADQHKALLQMQLQQLIQSVRQTLQDDGHDIPMLLDVGSADQLAVRIVRRVVAEGYDLIIKAAEMHVEKAGFVAIDMQLLRKCPCPVLLARPMDKHREAIRVAVAIDPKAETIEGRQLALHLLKLARSLADDGSGILEIISCWYYLPEESAWVAPSEDALTQAVNAFRAEHRAALERIILEAAIGGKSYVYHLNGYAYDRVPLHVIEHHIDILVMGSVARTGVPGLIMGNTAESIVQQLHCSLLALKPEGFVSPALL